MGIAVTFPGQGSQSAGMGAPWQDTPYWTWVTRAEEVLDHDVEPLLTDTDPARLRHTREAQLAVFLTSLLAWESTKDTLSEITAFAGHCATGSRVPNPPLPRSKLPVPVFVVRSLSLHQ